MRAIFVISFLLFIFGVNGFVIPELNSGDTVVSNCFNKYKNELNEINLKFLEELKSCKSAENIAECAKTAALKLNEAALEIGSKIKECIENGSNSESFLEKIDNDIDDLSLKDSVAIECLRKHIDDLVKIKNDLLSESKACKSNENVKDCLLAALSKAKAATLEVRNKIKKCIEDGSKPEEFLEEISNDENELSSINSVGRECWKKYGGELLEIKKNLRSELKACKSNNEPKQCIKDALSKAKTAALEVRNKIKKCIEDGSKPEEFLEEIDSDEYELSSQNSVRRECWKKYGGELLEIKKNLRSELKACKSNDEPKQCIKDALSKAKTAASEVRNKIKKCIEDGSKPEEFLEEIDSDEYELSLQNSVRRECWKKYGGELLEIKKNLRSELRACKSNDEPKQCIKDALSKAKTAALEVRNKIKKCIEDGSNKTENL